MFRVLGPLTVEVDGHEVTVAAGKQRAILAALLLRANRTVPISHLIETVWEDDAPANARAVVQKYVMRLRRTLDPKRGAEGTISTDPEGYRIRLQRGQLDLENFSTTMTRALRAAENGDRAAESALLTEALSWWTTTPPFSNVRSTSLHRYEVPGLLERYLHAWERRVEADLALGRHAGIVAELARLVRKYPERERFWAQWVRALHRSGRQSEALIAYREVVGLLAEELGVDPGAELRAAYREVLEGIPEPGTRTATGTRVEVPAQTHQLPGPTGGFTGRHAELAETSSALETSPVVITGLPGAGKTALAVRAAHQVADRFPDGQLFADLRGFAADPLTDVHAVLRRFLRALGGLPDAARESYEEQIAAYRSSLAGRRVLIVLDNVADAEAVRTLLPGSPGCALIVTSRDDLPGLLVSPGVRRIRLGELSADDSRALLIGQLGSRAGANRPAVDRLVQLCAGLPLALRVAAAQLAQRPDLTIADYVEQLRSTDDLVSALHIDGDDRASVGAAFDWSFRRLAPQDRRFLRALGHSPTSEFTVPVVARYTGTDERTCAVALEALLACGLLDRLPERRYRMHDLVRSYVRSRGRITDAAVS